MSGTVRQCKKDDIESIIDLSGYAYSIPDASFERFREKWDDIYDEFYLNEIDGMPIASARMIPLVQNLRGTMKPMGAIGLVAGSPEYRRKGYVRELMFGMLHEMQRQNYAVSCLYPFKDSFYTAMGYVKMPPTKTLELDPVHLKGITKPEGFTVSRETGDSAFEVWRSLHEFMVVSTHGAAKRQDIRWREYTKNFTRKIVVVRNTTGTAEAVMVYSIKGYGEGHDWIESGEMSIGEMHWTSLEGRDSLLHFIYGHTDQIKKAKLVVSKISDDYYHWMTDMHTPNITANILSMSRIIDIPTAYGDILVDKIGDLLIEVRDPHLEWNNGVFRFRAENGRIKVEKSKDKAKASLSIEGLTSILYGVLDEENLRRLGWLEGDFIPQLVEWFPRDIPWLTESF